MEGFIRFGGWILNVVFVGLFLDGSLESLGVWWHPAIHVASGIGVLLVAPILYILPYFQLIGLGAELSNAKDLDERESRLAFLGALKGKLFWAIVRTILLMVVGPIVGFLQRGDLVPDWSHGTVMLLFLVSHADLWARSMLVLRLARELRQP